MTERTKQRLRQALGRDTRVIHAFLRIIEQHEDELLIGKNKNRIDSSKLDQLTMLNRVFLTLATKSKWVMVILPWEELWKHSLSLGVMHQHKDRRKRPGLLEGSHLDDDRQSSC